jgi:hypothetical protein
MDIKERTEYLEKKLKSCKKTMQDSPIHQMTNPVNQEHQREKRDSSQMLRKHNP